MEVDSPERVGQEMKEVLGLPEVYIVAFQERLKQALSKYWKDNAKNIENQQAGIHALGEIISPTATKSVTITTKTEQTHSTNTCRAKLGADSDKISERNNSTFSSIQATLTTNTESAIKCKKVTN
eukprot:TRINITY_DN997_c0_g2_i7.p2 TRINITY_DN997_c0_g2~~TRINITY_DN997_c0_g2_i7.p2  ORF type:complete len:125 (-),score=15.82 TRINITY_DN997_c0_g2_i7:142-516(-)